MRRFRNLLTYSEALEVFKGIANKGDVSSEDDTCSEFVSQLAMMSRHNPFDVFEDSANTFQPSQNLDFEIYEDTQEIPISNANPQQNLLPQFNQENCTSEANYEESPCGMSIIGEEDENRTGYYDTKSISALLGAYDTDKSCDFGATRDYTRKSRTRAPIYSP